MSSSENIRMIEEGDIILYKTEQGKVKINVAFINEDLWLTQKSIAELFNVKVPAISKHLKNIFESGELDREATVSKMEIVQYEGDRKVLQGKVQAKVAKVLAEDIYSKYRVQQDKEYVSDFDREIKKQLGGSGYEF